jgi:hypothetical protein
VIAPLGWVDDCQSLLVGVRVLCRLNPAKGRENEVDMLFERHLTISEGLKITPGSQR